MSTAAHLFHLEFHKWKTLRAKITPTFSSGKMKQMFQTLVDSGSTLEKYMKKHDNEQPIDIKNVLGK